ncbi:MAG: hypothetical protein GY757_31045 [bacterium]|nr:hypothetical protein [bacterium]
MRKLLTISLIFVFITAALLLTGCKNATGMPDYKVTVYTQNGVEGFPYAGEHYFADGDEIEYNYTPKDNFTNLRVTLDGEEVPNAGTITVSGNHTLNAYADSLDGEFMFSVSIGRGAEGTPEGGVYYYNGGETVDYSYVALEDYTNLRVVLDGEQIADSGTITISSAHILNVFSDSEYDIRGEWTLVESYLNDSSFEVMVTFDGDIESGTVTDSDGGSGTYTVTGAGIEFTIEYPNVTYEYTGTIASLEAMSGSAKRITDPSNSESDVAGGWSASRTVEEETSLDVVLSAGRKNKGSN